MTARYEIMGATLAHMRAIAPRLREGDLAEIAATGMKPRHVLHKLWSESFVRRAALVDGEIAAVWGCGGALLSTQGEAWLLTAHAVERLPMAFMRVLRAELSEMLEIKPTIVSGVLSSYEKSIRFMKLAGFSVGEAQPMGNSTFLELRMER